MATTKTKKTPRQLAQAATGSTRSRARDEKPAPRETSIKFKPSGLDRAIPLLERLVASHETGVELMRESSARAEAGLALASAQHALASRSVAASETVSQSIAERNKQKRVSLSAIERVDLVRVLVVGLRGQGVELIGVGAGIQVDDVDEDGDLKEDVDLGKLVLTFRADPSDEAATEAMREFGAEAATEMMRGGNAPTSDDQPEDGDETVTEVSAPAAAQV